MEHHGKVCALIFMFLKVANAVLTGGNFPGTGGNFPGIGGNFPGTGGNFPGTGGNFPGTGGNFPGTGGNFPGTGGNFPGTGGYFPGTGPVVGGNTQSIQAPCGSSVEVQDGRTYFINSPGYPNAYAPFSSCQWYFYTSTNRPLVIDCPTFQLQPSTSCSSNNNGFLALDPGDRQYLWYCGNNGPRNVPSRSNKMQVIFWASWQNTNNYQGFYCTVNTNSFPTQPFGGNCRCGQQQPINRIVGGLEAGVHEFPWMALIRPSLALCGGVLINERFVLTAAHCIDTIALPNDALPTVVLGEHRLSTPSETPYTITVQAVRVWPHERYNKDQGVSFKDYDIGLVELEAPINFASTFPNIAPACAPDPLKSYDNLPVVVAGWGHTSSPGGQRSDVLRKVELRTVPVFECKSSYTAGVITNKMICAFATGKDACLDDSGAPLMAQEGSNWIVVGIVSFGPNVCATPTTSGVYTRIGDYIPWIQNKVGNARTCSP